MATVEGHVTCLSTNIMLVAYIAAIITLQETISNGDQSEE